MNLRYGSKEAHTERGGFATFAISSAYKLSHMVRCGQQFQSSPLAGSDIASLVDNRRCMR